MQAFRLLMVFLLSLVTACADTDQAGQSVRVTGTIIEKSRPAGPPVEAFFIALDQPVHVAGKSYGQVKIDTFNDSVLFYTAENVSRRVSATCLLRHGSSWSPDSVLCTSEDIQVEP